MGSKPGLSSAPYRRGPKGISLMRKLLLDLQGQTFPRSRLTAIYPTPIESKRGPIRGWVCVCECGWLTTVSTTSLLWGGDSLLRLSPKGDRPGIHATGVPRRPR